MKSHSNENDGIGKTTSTAFSRTTTVDISIQASPDIVWALLTNAQDFARWNSTVKSIDGRIQLGNTIKVKTTFDEDRTFTLKVSRLESPSRMIWKSGQAPFFQGVRTFTIDKKPGGNLIFTMTEKLSGLMFPMVARQIPDFKHSFERYAADLKTESEKIMNIKH